MKAFDGDVSLARRALEACGVGAFSLEDEGLSLAFHPRHISIVQALPVVLCRSINVLEETADGFIDPRAETGTCERRMTMTVD